MHTFKVDRQKCVSCGKCARDCPISVLEMKDGHPEFAKPESCIGCLHCYAICPVGAITFDSFNPADGLPLEALPDAKSVGAYIRQRRSIRSFESVEIPHDKLHGMLELAWSAPSGGNQHRLQVSVIDNIAEMNEFKKHIMTSYQR